MVRTSLTAIHAGYALDQLGEDRNLIRVMVERAAGAFNARMGKFERMLQRWTEAEMGTVTWRLCHPARGQPQVEFIAAQLEAVARQWYGELLAEVARVQRELPRL
jgi:hypothetical protein